MIYFEFLTLAIKISNINTHVPLQTKHPPYEAT